jgi:hypothetical protein
MASCVVDLSESVMAVLDRLEAEAQDEIGFVIKKLEEDCVFKPDPAEYIYDEGQGELTGTYACEHVRGWGWKLIWYREGAVRIVVLAAQSAWETLQPKRRPRTAT